MTRYLLTPIILVSLLTSAFAADRKEDPNQLFYSGNNNYEKREYAKAVEQYLKILDMGIESGSLYYNIGNGFFKLGKLGYAILCYEKARRLVPRDSDLKSNLLYARSLAGARSSDGSKFLNLVKRPFSDFNLNAIAISSLVFYIFLMVLLAFFIVNPFASKRFKHIFFIFAAIFLVNLCAFGVRYYDEEIARHGIVVSKETESRYEPIDKSTVYYSLHEGEDVIVITIRGEWMKIKNVDGKVGWVKWEAVGEI